MADGSDVNLDVVDLAHSLLLYSTRDDYTQAVACDEFEEKSLAKATESWGKGGEDIYLGFLLMIEGITVLQYGAPANEDGKQDDCRSNEKVKMLDEQEATESVLNKTFRHSNPNKRKRFRRMFGCISSRTESKNAEDATKRSTEQDIELSSLSRVRKPNEKSIQHRTENQGSVDGLDVLHDGFRVTICEPELDLTTTEDEEDSTHALGSGAVARPNGVQTKPVDSELNGNVNLITNARLLEAKSKFKEAQNRLKRLSLGQRQISLSNRLKYFRLAIACTMLMTVDNPNLGLEDCRNLIGQLNSLKSVRRSVTKVLGQPSSFRQRINRTMYGAKQRKILDKVHFINYMVWKWMMLCKGSPVTGLEVEIPCIEADFGAVHPIDDWHLRDKCQTCVEFIHKMHHSSTLAVNSKDHVILIDAQNIITTYTIEGKPLVSFRASTRRHPHSRWIIGVDEVDNIYVGSTLGIRYDRKRPLSVFSPAGRLVGEPEFRGFQGSFNLYTVTKKGFILILAVGTSLGHVVSVHGQQSKEMVTSFRVREIEFPRHFTTGRDTIIVGGTTSTDSNDFAFQIFDQSGQQLFYFKPEVKFQSWAVDPWSGNIILTNVNTLRNYRYYMCDTVILTGEIHFLSPSGESVRSSVKLRWPFRVVAGVTVLRCGLVVLVTVDEVYHAIHVI